MQLKWPFLQISLGAHSWSQVEKTEKSTLRMNIQAHVGGRMFGKRKETDLEAFVQMEDSRMHFLSSIKWNGPEMCYHGAWTNLETVWDPLI